METVGEHTIADSNSKKVKKITALIVEDNAVFRQSFEEHLQIVSPDLAIQVATDGKEALEKVDAFRPQLIFMDIRLPGENGLSLTKKIKAKYPETLVVVLTSYDNPEYRDAALQSGASRFVSKDSLNFEEIAALISSI